MNETNASWGNDSPLHGAPVPFDRWACQREGPLLDECEDESQRWWSDVRCEGCMLALEASRRAGTLTVVGHIDTVGNLSWAEDIEDALPIVKVGETNAL